MLTAVLTLIPLVAGADADDVPALVASLIDQFQALEAKPMAQWEVSAYARLTFDIDAARARIDRLLREEKTTLAVAGPARQRLVMLSKQVDAATDRATRYRWMVSRGWSEAIMDDVFARRIAVGMTTAHVLAAWDGPRQINHTATSDGWREEWVYEDAVVFFRGDRVTAIRQRRSIVE